METNFVVEHFSAGRPPLRVAVVTETFPPEINGVAMTVRRLVDGLVAQGHTVQLIRPRQKPGDTGSVHPGFEEVLARGLPIPRYAGLRIGLPERSTLTRLWSQKRPDIVHVVTEGPLGWAAVSAARKLKLPVSSSYHTNFDRYSGHYGLGWLQRSVDACLKKFHNRTDITFVPTEALGRELGGRGYRNLEVVARGVDTRLFSPERRSPDLRRQWGVEATGLAVLHVGRLAPEKNLPQLLRSFEAIQAVRPEARLILVGDGPSRAELERQHPQHRFVGMKSGVELAEHYASGDLFLFPSLTETFGNVTLEAMASGLAVVAYAYAAAAETIRDGVDGLLVELGDADEFSALAAILAGDPVLIGKLGREARERVLPLDWQRIHEVFAQRIRETVQRHHRRTIAASAMVLLPD